MPDTARRNLSSAASNLVNRVLGPPPTQALPWPLVGAPPDICRMDK